MLSAAADQCLSGLAGNRWYRGGLDSAVLPFAVMSTSAANHIRVGFLHKQSQEDKETSAASHDGQVLLSTTLHMHSVLDLLCREQDYASALCHTRPDLSLGSRVSIAFYCKQGMVVMKALPGLTAWCFQSSAEVFASEYNAN